MGNGTLNWVGSYIRGGTDDVLRDVYVRAKYRYAGPAHEVIRRDSERGAR